MIETREMWIGFRKKPEEHLNVKFSDGFTPIKFLGETKTEFFTFAGFPAKQNMAKYLVEIHKGE